VSTIDWGALRATRTLAETEDYLVLDKPAGLSVMGERYETDLVRIARDAGEELIPVHRIDKVTSGVVLLARTKAAHGPLTRQFAKRTVHKQYLAITRTAGLPEQGTVDLPLCVGRKNRVRVAAPRDDIGFDEDAARWSVPPESVRARSFPSLSTFSRLWEHPAGQTVLAVTPTTGRRHQIRVHLAWIGHPIVGDPLFPGPGAGPDGRTCLHAWRLEFDSADGVRIRVGSTPDDGFWAPVHDELPAELRASLAT
jgi:tRNA pseudouridine32 synthase/23S rRNA pseudouridine746 synthase/23S rRNA pseudouridine1911/1915/1917 synthase